MSTPVPVENEVYLDYQSARPVDPRVVDAMLPYFGDRFGNPASLHAVGDRATDVLRHARERVARAFGADPEEILFTAGATEATNIALVGYALRNRRKGDHVVMAETDHISVHNIAKYLVKQGFSVTKVPPDQYGRISPDRLRARLRDETLLVSVGWASNEIGTVQPMAEIAEMLDGSGIVLHSDAVAALGQLPVDMSALDVGMASLSSNDIYGPPGVGALFLRKGVNVAPVLLGGGQERGIRSGTENLPGIVGMARAAELMTEEFASDVPRIQALRDRLIERVLSDVPDTHLNGHPTERLPNNAHFRFEGIEGEALVLRLRDAGIAASTGSACSSKTLEPSHTLISCGLLHEEAHGSLEFSLGRWSTDADVDRALEVIPGVVSDLRKLSPLYDKE